METSNLKKLKIAIVGPESSGKSTLVQQLSKELQAPFVEEFARSFVEKNPHYELQDLNFIAKQQLRLENDLFSTAQRFFICDTDPLSIKVWSIYKYGSCSNEIVKIIDQSHYDLHLLLSPDLPYEFDPMRENPQQSDRVELFNLFKQELDNYNFPYYEIKGLGKERLKSALTVLKTHFSF